MSANHSVDYWNIQVLAERIRHGWRYRLFLVSLKHDRDLDGDLSMPSATSQCPPTRLQGEEYEVLAAVHGSSFGRNEAVPRMIQAT